MQVTDYYQERVDNFRGMADQLQKRENRLSYARLISFLGTLVIFFLLISYNLVAAIVTLVTGLIIFGSLVKIFIRTEKNKNFYTHLVSVNQSEFNCIKGDISSFTDGSAYLKKEHPYSLDLDLFGHASLFQYINRTTSKPAADMLAEWLMEPAPINEINNRQQAIDELKPLVDWRQKLMVLGYTNRKAGDSPAALKTWVQSANLFARVWQLKMVTSALTAFTLTVLALIVIFKLPFTLLLLDLGINFVYYFIQAKKINQLHQQVSNSSELLLTYADTIHLIEHQDFKNSKLKSLREVFLHHHPASGRIKKLSELVGRLDTRLNIMISVPLNLFFFWDIHYCLALEKWKTQHRNELSKWFTAMAEFEVLSCFANMAFNNPGWVQPEVINDYFELNAVQAGHPLIPENRRICNDISMKGSGKTIVITGSNMAGKTTFLRTCGVNAVLALAGACVCAKSFKISHVNVLTSMRISDSLEDNTSSFYAELKRLASIIDQAKNNQRVFLLLDEILRGTNSNDRHTGSVALIRQLIDYGAITFIATHDLKLADMAGDKPDKIDNYYFDVKVENEELYFDYKLTPGVCNSMNASILMKKMGIRM